VSVHHRERRYGRSQFFTVKRITATYADLLKMWLDLMLVYRLRRLVGLGAPVVEATDPARAEATKSTKTI
jgi:hypothetical protein